MDPKGKDERSNSPKSGHKVFRRTTGRMRTRSEHQGGDQGAARPESNRRIKRRIPFGECSASKTRKGLDGLKRVTTVCVDVSEIDENEAVDPAVTNPPNSPHLEPAVTNALTSEDRGDVPETVDTSTRVEPARSTEPNSVVGRSTHKDFFKHKNISTCKVVPSSLFDGREISWASTMKSEVMWPFFNLSDKVYPDLVREFYANIIVPTDTDEELFVDTTVNSKKMHMIVQTLGEILQVPAVGPNLLKLTKEDQDKAYRRGVQIAHVKGKGKKTLNKIGELSAENRLLHHIISYQVFPRSGDFSAVHRNDLIVLVDLIQGKDINLPEIILTEIIRSVQRKRKFSPYGSVVTKICRHFAVDMSDPGPSVPCVEITGTSLKQMKIGTDPETNKLVRLNESVPSRQRSGSSKIDDVLDVVTGMAKDIKQLLQFHEEKAQFLIGLDAKLDKLVKLGESSVAAAEGNDDVVGMGANVEDTDEGDGNEQNANNTANRADEDGAAAENETEGDDSDGKDGEDDAGQDDGEDEDGDDGEDDGDQSDDGEDTDAVEEGGDNGEGDGDQSDGGENTDSVEDAGDDGEGDGDQADGGENTNSVEDAGDDEESDGQQADGGEDSETGGEEGEDADNEEDDTEGGDDGDDEGEDGDNVDEEGEDGDDEYTEGESGDGEDDD